VDVLPTMQLSVESLDQEQEMLKRELAVAQASNLALKRELKKVQTAAAEASRAHAKMVTTLIETMRENTALTIERDAWKYRAQRQFQDYQQQIKEINGLLHLDTITEAEASAIRKAMARLHHPDSGGNPERMKAWNAILDYIAQQ
jgi:hypothetical protein